MAKQIQLKPTTELMLRAVPEVDSSLRVPGVFEQGFVKDEEGFGEESGADDEPMTGLRTTHVCSCYSITGTLHFFSHPPAVTSFSLLLV